MLEEGGGETCDESAVLRAIKNYQRTYNLPETGELDEETKSLMSTSRCGNKDDQKDQVKKKLSFKDKSTKDVLFNRTDLALPKQDFTDSNDDGEGNKSSLVKSHRLWKRSSQVGRSKLFRVLTGEKPKTRTLEWHKKHIEEYIQKIRSEAKGRRRLLHHYTPKERKKRSVHVWSPTNLHLRQFGNDNGALFNKDVIRWRLLTTGFSTRIPVEDQRATIDLAFRMWSEVIPLRFVEDTSSDIHSVDIEIAFGKG